MKQALATLSAALLLILAGCTETPTAEDPDGHDEHDDDGDDGHNDTVDPGNASLVATLTASASNGTAPFNTTFDLSAVGASANATWSLDFGDGNATNGTSLPASANHTFDDGNFTVTLTVTDGNRTAMAEVALAIEEAAEEAVRELPATTNWVLGPSMGCAWDLATIAGGPPLPCAGLAAGPDAAATPDGHWITLGEAYWGLQMVSTVDRGTGHGSSGSDEDWPRYDSDCWFIAADGETQLGDGHNGGGACAGIIPDGSAYVFLAPYGLPALEMIVDVQLPA